MCFILLNVLNNMAVHIDFTLDTYISCNLHQGQSHLVIYPVGTRSYNFQ